MTKQEIINRLNIIAEEANSYDNGYHYEVIVRDWNNYGKSRTYFSIVETRDNSKHYVKKDYGYYDNNADEYVTGKANIDYDFSGNHKIEIEEETEAEAETEVEAETETEAEVETETTKEETTMTTTIKKFVGEVFTGEKTQCRYFGELWDRDAIGDYIEAVDAGEAIEIAKDYLLECAINNGHYDIDRDDFEVRVAEIDENYDHGEWVYDDEM